MITQSGQFKVDTGVFNLLYTCFFSQKLLICYSWLQKSNTCLCLFLFYAREKQYKNSEESFLFPPHCLISELGFLWKGRLVDGWFWISGHNTHTETGITFNDGFQSGRSSLVTIPCIVKRDLSPGPCYQRYPIPRLEERSFEQSRRCRRQFVSEGQSKSQTGRGNPSVSG